MFTVNTALPLSLFRFKLLWHLFANIVLGHIIHQLLLNKHTNGEPKSSVCGKLYFSTSKSSLFLCCYITPHWLMYFYTGQNYNSYQLLSTLYDERDRDRGGVLEGGNAS